MPKVVIIGGSYAGLGALSAIFKNSSSTLEVTVVAPSTHAYFNVVAPRLLSEPEKFEKTAVSIQDIVNKYDPSKASFVHGLVVSTDLENRKLSVKLIAGGVLDLEYDILVIASGTEAKWKGYKVNQDYQDARKAILSASKALKDASSVAIIGGGPTGVESAGEIAAEYKQASVTLYTGSSGPLVSAAESLSAKATSKLQQLGVEIVNNVHVKSVIHDQPQEGATGAVDPESGATGSTVMLENGEKSHYDLVLESYIVGPYSSFLPGSIKDDKGFVVTDGNLLVKGQHGVVALGDIVAGSSKTYVDLKFRQMGIFSTTFSKLLQDTAETSESKYVPVTHTLLVPISRNGGVGIFYWIPLPNFIVWFGKARTYMIEKVMAGFV
ncbi:hypothetical protein JCM33374_g1544 [Metschnikowia sp. JCM 33374]|nr:hypothetical protein JCM33374_g1544 [Metschnikowia sp. JCM 33374]